MFDLVVNNAMIVTGERTFCGSLAVHGEVIAQILKESSFNPASSKIVIDGTGKYLFPGIIDAHVHSNEPGFTWREDFEHASRAAAAGGVTTIIDMPLQNEPALFNREAFLTKETLLENKSIIDYAFWGALVNYNLEHLKELNTCGVVAYKSFFAPVSNDYTPLMAGQIRHALSIIKEFDGLAGFHCEDYSLIMYEQERAVKEGRLSRTDFLNARPVIAELIAVQTIISLAKEQDVKVQICHVSHPAVAAEIKKAKADGVKITAETCPHYLIYNEEDFLEKGPLLKCAPPLRSKEDAKRLWDYVCDGTLDMISSDHSPCAPHEKSEEKGIFEAWGGISGLQNGLQILFNYAVAEKGLSPSILAKSMAENPARIFSLSDRKGFLKINHDADMVLIDPEKLWEITPDNLHYLNPISAFVGLKGKGTPVCTILRGKVIMNDGNITIDHGYGHLLKKAHLL